MALRWEPLTPGQPTGDATVLLYNPDYEKPESNYAGSCFTESNPVWARKTAMKAGYTMFARIDHPHSVKMGQHAEYIRVMVSKQPTFEELQWLRENIGLRVFSSEMIGAETEFGIGKWFQSRDSVTDQWFIAVLTPEEATLVKLRI